MKRLLSTTAALIIAGTSTAFAGNLLAPLEPVFTPPPAPAFEWTGLYLGIHSGLGRLDDGITTQNGTWAGAQVGYLYDFGNIVVGGELAYSQVTQRSWPDNLTTLSLKGRVGYDAGKFQPYLVAGATRWTSDIQGNATSYLFGLGLDYQIGAHTRLGIEYIHNANPNFTYDGSGLSYNAKSDMITISLNFTF